MWRALISLAVFSVLGAGRAVAAESSETAADVRCVIISAVMLDAETELQRRAGILSFLYFQGRIDGREPGYDLEAALRREAPRMQGDLLASEAKRCGAILTERGKEITAIGKHLQDVLPTLPSS